jgi:hypothetical protein
MVRMQLESVERIGERAGMTGPMTDLHPAAFVDRFGTLCLPFEGVEKLARAFAAAEPETVLLYIEDQEAVYKARGYEPGERFWHDYLREKAGGYALAGQWAGHEQELERLHKELDRLRSLISTAAYDLERAGPPRAGRLRRALRGMSQPRARRS